MRLLNDFLIMVGSCIAALFWIIIFIVILIVMIPLIPIVAIIDLMYELFNGDNI